MADKNIGSLPAAASFDDSSKLIAEQQGEAVQVGGALLRKFAEEAGKKAAETITQGPPGEGFRVLGYYDTLDELNAGVPSPVAGDTYGVGTEEPYDIYIWDGVNLVWKNNGPIQGAKGDPFTYEDFTPEQLEDLTGPAGKDGNDGKDGSNGKDGVSPVVSISAISGGHRVTITDVNGTRSFDIMDGEDGQDGSPGADGYTPVKGKDYFDGEDGADGYTPVKGKDYFDGEDGAPGEDGVSPTVSVASITGGTRVTITDANGTKSFDVMNGKDGAAGEGSGDMLASMYDPQGRRLDIFAYVDELFGDSDGILVKFLDEYVADANTWLTNGYVKTGKDTQNLLPTTATDKWGVLFFIAENAAAGTGTQMHFPIDGTYKGRVFTRSIVRKVAGDWKLLAMADDEVQAERVAFDDGETFQQKYDSGELTGPAGADGESGVTFTPSVDAEGNLSWSNDGGLSNPSTVNIKGPAGKDGNDGQPGEDGEPGQDGEDGVSPTVSVASITGGHRITITDVNGTKTVDVMDGSDGKDGNDGSPGADGDDGVGIASIEQTTTSTADGGENVFTVTLTNGNKATFTVKNGSKGSDGAAGPAGSDANVDEHNVDETAHANLVLITVEDIDAICVAEITFAIEGGSYTAEEGMTWGEWVESDYNVGGFVSDGSYIFNDNFVSVLSPDGLDNPIKATDVIIAGAEYYIEGGLEDDEL